MEDPLPPPLCRPHPAGPLWLPLYSCSHKDPGNQAVILESGTDTKRGLSFLLYVVLLLGRWASSGSFSTVSLALCLGASPAPGQRGWVTSVQASGRVPVGAVSVLLGSMEWTGQTGRLSASQRVFFSFISVKNKQHTWVFRQASTKQGLCFYSMHAYSLPGVCVSQGWGTPISAPTCSWLSTPPSGAP